MGEHTKTPWNFDTDDLATWINSPAYPQPIAKMGACRDFDQKANAAFIIKAVNSHEAMVKALRDIIAANNEFRKGMPDGWEGDPLQDACHEAAKLLLDLK